MATKKLPEASRWKPRHTHQSIDPDYCRAIVFGIHGSGQCSFKVKPGTEWCGRHSPEAIAKREEKRRKKYRERQERWERSGREQAQGRERLAEVAAELSGEEQQ
jgi:hypothetical protein